jgi:hypothetical protein
MAVRPASAQILPKPTVTSPTVYAGTPPTGFRVSTATPVSVHLAWNAASGATGYKILRTTGVGQPWTTVTATPITALDYLDGTGIDYRSTYIYRLEAQYSASAPGYVDMTVTLPKPVNPSGIVAKQSAEGAVRITWDMGVGAPAYMVYGPGLPNGAASTTSGGITATGLPEGNHTWRVASLYQPGNITSPATEFPSIAARVLPWSGTYRISLTGFTALSTTVDDLLDADGKGDEVIPIVLVRAFMESSGLQKSDAWVKGNVHGEAGGKFRGRTQAGTGTNRGGIIPNDMYPAGLTSGATGTPSATTFPLKLYEGPLTRDYEALVLLPSLWESDNAPSRWRDAWEINLRSSTVNLMSSTQVRQALLQPGISEVRGSLSLRMPSYGVDAAGDRPIGVEAIPSADGRNDGGFYDRLIVLNQRKIEEALREAPKYPGMPAGTIGLSFREGGVIRVSGTPDPTSWNFSGLYVLYLRVERIK